MESLALAVTLILAGMFLGFLCALWAIIRTPRHVLSRLVLGAFVLVSLLLAAPLVIDTRGALRVLSVITVLTGLAGIHRLLKPPHTHSKAPLASPDQS